MSSARRKRRAHRLRDARLAGAIVQPLTWGERLDILDALALVLDGVYVHLPLKRSLYGLDVIRGIEHLRQQVPTLSDLAFHRELTSLINRLRDAHTQYQGPWTGDDPVASLPFLVESYGPVDHPTYIVSKVDRSAIGDPNFRKGVTIEYWNGIPFDRAVELHAERETGGRPDSRRARALETLTSRSLEYGAPPDEDWVVLGYRDLKGKGRQIRLNWEGIDPGRAPTASVRVATRIRRGINPAAEAVRRAKKYRFNPELWRAELAPQARGGIEAKYADFISSKKVRTSRGMFGYLRIWSFDVDDDDEFLRAAIAHLRRLPDQGLIIDLRANPGGFIWAAERMLQLFTPNPITPTKFALRATPLTSAMARTVFNQEEFALWKPSLLEAERTGEPYSSHIPITPADLCNNVGQQYGGPVVVTVDANTYSSGDLFTAGVVDNRIGPVICIGQATGAGGANVWDSDDLRAALDAARAPLPPLPEGVRFTVAMRRAVRSGDADGTLIEDAGVPGQSYAMTRRDLLNNNKDLLEHCAALLSEMSRTRLEVKRRGTTLKMESVGLDQLDVYVDGHPACSPVTLAGNGRVRVRVPVGEHAVEVVGFSEGTVKQRRRLTTGRRS